MHNALYLPLTQGDWHKMEPPKYTLKYEKYALKKMLKCAFFWLQAVLGPPPVLLRRAILWGQFVAILVNYLSLSAIFGCFQLI